MGDFVPDISRPDYGDRRTSEYIEGNCFTELRLAPITLVLILSTTATTSDYTRIPAALLLSDRYIYVLHETGPQVF